MAALDEMVASGNEEEKEEPDEDQSSSSSNMDASFVISHVQSDASYVPSDASYIMSDASGYNTLCTSLTGNAVFDMPSSAQSPGFICHSGSCYLIPISDSNNQDTKRRRGSVAVPPKMADIRKMESGEKKKH